MAADKLFYEDDNFYDDFTDVEYDDCFDEFADEDQSDFADDFQEVMKAKEITRPVSEWKKQKVSKKVKLA